MSLTDYIEQIFPIVWISRESNQEKNFFRQTNATVTFFQRKGNDNMISSVVECNYNRGGHGEKCELGGICPYAINIPYAIDRD